VEIEGMDQSTLRAFLKIVWGALFVVLGILAALSFFLILRSGIFRSFHFREPKEIEEKPPWRERIRDWFLHWHPPWK
jgi:hypothetical protein